MKKINSKFKIRNSKNHFFKILFFIPLLLFFCSCSKYSDNANTLNLHIDSDPITLDPALMTDVRSGRLSALLYDTLIQYDENLQIIPGLAGSWRVAQNGRVYTFQIKKGVTFSDGTPLTIEDIRFSFERVANPKTASPRSWIMSYVQGYEKFRSNHVEHLAGIKVLAPHKLSITLAEPYAPFLALLTMPNASVLSKEALRKNQVLGTGPFVLDHWKHDQEILLRANHHYFGNVPRIQSIRFRMIKETLFVSSEFRRGRLDLIEVPSTELTSYLNDPALKEQVMPISNLSLYYLGFNCTRSPLHTPKVRKAIAQAIDKEKIINTLRHHRATLLNGPIPPGVFGYQKFSVPSYNEHEARKELELYQNQFPKALRLLQSTHEETLELSEAIQAQLARVGVPVKIVELEWSAFKAALARGDFDLFLLSWWADYPDGENFLYPLFHSSSLGSGGNYTQFQNPQIDKLIFQSRKTVSDQKRLRLYTKIQKKILAQSPMVFLYSSRSLIVKQPWITGFNPHPLYNGNKLLSVKKKEPI